MPFLAPSNLFSPFKILMISRIFFILMLLTLFPFFEHFGQENMFEDFLGKNTSHVSLMVFYFLIIN
jgi:hypothetical protein